MVSQATGASYPAVSDKIVRSALVPQSSYEEQCRISKILDGVASIADKRKVELKALDDLIKARFVEMFGDPLTNPKEFPIKTIDEVAVLNKGITYSPEDVSDEGMIVLRSSNIKGNVFDLEDLVKVAKKISPDKYVQENDILMCNRNGSARLVGKVAMIPKLDEDMTFGTFMTIVRSDIYEYLFAFFQMEAFREQIKFQTAVAINQISLPLLASVKVPVPARELIDEFAMFTKQVYKSKVAVQKALDETQLLFDSLMKEYFG
jgi:type I restriction enzyme S subunit